MLRVQIHQQYLHLNNFDRDRIFAYRDLSLSYCFDIIIATETLKCNTPEIYGLNGYVHYYNEGNYNQNDGVIDRPCERQPPT